MQDLDEVGLVRHDLVDALVGAGNFVEHAFVLPADHAFGLAFQFPIVLIMLNRIGILTYGFLAARRRFVVVIIVLVAIVITPGGDPVSSGILSLIMYGLFEGALQVMRMARRRR